MFDKQLETVRRRFLGSTETVHIATQVRPVEATQPSLAALPIALGSRAMLILTDRRLLVVRRRWPFSRPSVDVEWPNRELRFTSSAPRLGPSQVHVDFPGGGSIDFECLAGAPASRWSKAQYRSRSVSRFRPVVAGL